MTVVYKREGAHVDPARPVKEAVAIKGWAAAYRFIILRRLSQVFFLGLFLTGPWFGLWIAKGTLASSMTLGTLPLTDPLIAVQSLVAGHMLERTAIVGSLIVLAVYGLIGGRMYCSWVCPVNLATDGANWMHRRLGLKKGWQPNRKTKYWVLALVVIASAITGTVFWEFFNPITILHREIVYGMILTSGSVLALLAAIFLFDLFVSRHGWCGHLCPVGAFYGLVGKFRVPAVGVPRRAACDDCMACYAVCPEPHILPSALKGSVSSKPIVQNIDCTTCGRCIDVCPQSVFQLTTRLAAQAQDVEPAASAKAA